MRTKSGEIEMAPLVWLTINTAMTVALLRLVMQMQRRRTFLLMSGFVSSVLPPVHHKHQPQRNGRIDISCR
jgi:hypothetical protein